MDPHSRLPRLLLWVGLAGMLVGAIDPLEGSLLIAPATGLVWLGARLARSTQQRLLAWAFAGVAFGVAALWGVSEVGGFRGPAGSAGLSWWWGLWLLPYPVGWLMGLVGAVRALREARRV